MGSVRDELLSKYKKKDEEKERGQPPSGNKQTVTNNGGASTRAAMLDKYAGGGLTVQSKPGANSSSLVNDDYINAFIKDSQRYVKSYSAMLKNPSWGSINTADNRKILSDRTADLTSRSKEIRSYLNENKALYDDKTYDAVLSYLNNFSASHRDINDAFLDAQKYFSQWETEADYDAYVAYQKDYEEKSKFDLEAGEQEIAELEKERERIKNVLPGVGFSKHNFQAPIQKDSRLEAIDAEIAQKKQYLNQARHIQEGITLSGVIDNADFKENSGYVSTKGDGWWNNLTSDFGMGYDDVTYEYINGAENGMRQEIINKAVSYDADTDNFFIYDHMTEDQIAIYNYHYAKEGKEAADKYLDSIRETLNYQEAVDRYGKLEGKTGLELLFGIEAGVDQFQSGIKNIFNTEDDYIAQTATQMASGMVREDLADDGFKIIGNSVGQVAYDAITTGANMAPSIMTSTVMNFLVPGSGAAVGAAMMGASASGNAYQEMLNLGYDKDQARGYSALVGASEAGLQYLLGGIGKLGGKLSGNIITKMMNGVDNAFLRTAIKLGGNMLSEGLEEGLQEILTPWFQNLIMHTDEEINWSEVAYSTLLGALTAGIMEGGGTISTEVNTYRSGRQLQNAGITAQRLAELGNTFAADTVAHQLAGRVTENTGAYTMGRLFNEIGAEITELNKSDIQKSLVRKGFSEKAAQKNAEIFATVVAGGQFTEFQQAVIESNDALAKTVSDVIINPNSTVNQRSQGYNEMLKSLADEMTGSNASRTNPAQQSEENAPTTDTVDTRDNEGVQSLSEADAMDTNPAKVQSISTIKDSQVTVKLEDGSEVNVKEADLDPNDGVRIETIAQIAGISSEDANYILGILKDSPSINARFDALGAKEVYNYGVYGISDKHLAQHGVFANSLTKSQRQAVYEVGQRARAQKAEAEQATVRNNRTVGEKSGKVHFEGDRSKLTDRQSASLTAMEKVADILGVQIHVFESEVNERGKRVGANGWYDPKDHSIHIDLHAGANGEGTMLFTAAHELTHFIREWSPAKFKTLADFLMQEYGKKGVNVDALVREQMAKAKRNGRTISYATAYEEVVADSMETMLADGKVMEKLARLKAQDKSLWQKIKDFISELAAKIRAVYDGLAPDSVEGRYVAEMVDSIERLQDLFTEALVDASENYQGSLNPGEEGTVYDQSGDPVAHATSDGTIQLSMRTYEESGRKEFRKYLQKCVKNKRLTKAEMQEMLDGIEDIYMTCKEFKDKFAPFSSWSDAAVVRDTFGKPVFSVVTPNGDYKMNLDFSLVCKKRRTLDAVFNEMSKRGIIDNFELGQKSVVKINEIIRKYGLETACALCFVDAKRFRQASMADSFTKLYNELVLSLVPEDQRSSIDHFNFSGYETIKKVEDGIHNWDDSKLDFSHLDEVMQNYGDGTVEYKAAKYIKANAEGRKLLLRGDFMSSQGFDAVKTQNPDVLKLYNSKKGTGCPKAAFGDVQYLNEIIQKAQWWTPEKAYAVGGVRIQSFSDYVPRMVFDYVQMIYDLAATKLPAHAYTKEALFVKQFGLTGIKINMSLIPAIAEGGIAPGLDANGNYVWAGESFDYDTAKEIQNAEGYSENCGTICVGVSKEHIIKLLRDPNIRMVIPYHKSGLNPIVAHMNKIAEFHDYTNDQRTKGKDGKALEEDFDFSKALHDMGENASPKAVADQYLKWCAVNGYTARFAEFAMEDNYYKLLEDFTLYDKDGNYVPQREVRAVFPKADSAFGSMKDLIKEGLEEDAVVEGKRDKNLSKIVDEIQKTLPKTEAEIAEEQVTQADRDLEAEVKLSDRDSDGKTLTKDQQEFFKDSKARDKKGRLLTLYHGSDSRFTVYDTGKSDDKASIFLTDKRDVAQSYTYNRRDVDPYDEFDAHTASVEEVLDRYRQISPEDPLRAMTEEEMKSAQNTFDKGIENAMQKVGEMLTVFESTGYSRSFGYRNMKRMFDSIRNQTGNHIDAYYMKGIAENLGRIMENDFPSARPAVEAAQEAVATIAEAAEILSETEHGTVLYRGENARGWDKYVADDRIRGTVNSAYRGGVIPLYANITNPFEVDAEGKNWNKVKTPAAMLSTGRYGTTVKTREISLFAKENGYDGVIIRNLYDLGGKVDVGKKKSTVLIAFDSNQIKSTANLNPTSDPDIRYSDRDSNSVSNRSLLANAFEGVAQNDIERQRLQEYKGKIDLINSEERKLQELSQRIKDLSFSKGPKDTKAIKDLQFEAKQTANRISTYDKQLLRLEASKPLQDVLTREKKMAYQRAEKKGKEALAAYRERATKTQREMLERWQESRKKGIESREKTAMRHKIQHVVGELNNLLLSNDKKRHVPDSLKKAVADALALVNMDTVGAEERAAKYANLIANETDPDKIDAYTATMENILRQGEKMGQRLKDLRDAYEEIQESDDPDIANAYDPVIAGCLKELSQSIGNTSLRNMTIEQMSDVYDMYRMVLTRVRDANKTMLDNIKESISNLASRVIGEVRMSGGEHKYRAAMLDPVRKFLWNNLKPVYAMEHIGSATLTKVFDNVRSGEDTWAKDVTEARAYYLEKSKKYGYDSWDFKKKYRFQSASDLEFELTLEQILSLYAYSKREQAHDHLRLGGFVFDSNIETYKDKDSKLIKYKVNTADAHQITPEILADITGKLTKEQIGFVDEMQEYLSTAMGTKGNEVTMKMYGVKLFKEKFYFPLKSAKQFMFEQNEVAGEVKIKNSGFTNKVVAKANNPVILSNFMDVWSGHVNDMSMYHAFTLPLEDFNRVFNYNSPKAENTPPVSVKGTIQSAYSPAAVQYVKNLITDLNGGARTDPSTDFLNKMMGLFKKGSVFASLSVVIQQPSAIARAAALVDTKHFIGPKVDHKRHKLLWDEVKRYAPVAIIKEMGYFDTNMGKSTKDFILGKEYSGFQEKMKALVTDSNYRDEVLSKAPALADELAWCSIWEAVKRETHAKHPGLDAKSEPFLMLAGSRFTEVITKTQVYDSVLSRSALMRSKDTGMKMVTSFMGEPTTSINMIADALLQGKRGNRKYARATIGAVIASQILNSILVSFVYAGRDDDEDKTYAEKYIGTLTGEVIDSLNPATYIPFVKDIVSITQGYDVERSDMAVISDLWNAWENLQKDNVSVYRKVEGFAGSIAQIFGLPVKNIMRDVRGIYQTIESFMSGQQTTKAGIGYSVKSSLPKWMGGGDVTNQNQLYEAILSGDQAQIARVKGRYKDDDAVNSAIRKALREHDPRIHEAAVAWNANDLDEYMRIARQIIGEKHFSQDNVVMAIRAEANALLPDEETSGTSKAKGLFTADKFAEAIAQGDAATANAIKTDVIQTAQKNGKTAAEAEKSFSSSAKTDIKELLFAGRISEAKAIDTLVKYCGLEQADAEEVVSEWVFEDQHGFKYSDRGDVYKSGKISAYELRTILIDVGGKTEEEADLQIQVYDWEADGYDGATAAAVREYNEFCVAYDVPKDVYLHIRSFSNNTDNYVDVNGKTIYYSAMKKVMAEIDAQIGLGPAQKTAIARSLGWSEKNIQKYKLW